MHIWIMHFKYDWVRGETKLFLFLLNLSCSPTCAVSQGVSVRGWSVVLKINVILWTGVLMKALHFSVHVFNLRCFALLFIIVTCHSRIWCVMSVRFVMVTEDTQVFKVTPILAGNFSVHAYSCSTVTFSLRAMFQRCHPEITLLYYLIVFPGTLCWQMQLLPGFCSQAISFWVNGAVDLLETVESLWRCWGGCWDYSGWLWYWRVLSAEAYSHRHFGQD